jgi:hypothetical protein
VKNTREYIFIWEIELKIKFVTFQIGFFETKMSYKIDDWDECFPKKQVLQYNSKRFLMKKPMVNRCQGSFSKASAPPLFLEKMRTFCRSVLME